MNGGIKANTPPYAQYQQAGVLGLGNAGSRSPNGVGVTYSNVVLGGGVNPANRNDAKSSY